MLPALQALVDADGRECRRDWDKGDLEAHEREVHHRLVGLGHNRESIVVSLAFPRRAPPVSSWSESVAISLAFPHLAKPVSGGLFIAL